LEQIKRLHKRTCPKDKEKATMRPNKHFLGGAYAWSDCVDVTKN